MPPSILVFRSKSFRNPALDLTPGLTRILDLRLSQETGTAHPRPYPGSMLYLPGTAIRRVKSKPDKNPGSAQAPRQCRRTWVQSRFNFPDQARQESWIRTSALIIDSIESRSKLYILGRSIFQTPLPPAHEFTSKSWIQYRKDLEWNPGLNRILDPRFCINHWCKRIQIKIILGRLSPNPGSRIQNLEVNQGLNRILDPRFCLNHWRKCRRQ